MLLCLLFLTGVPALTPSPVSAGPRGGLTPGTDISLCLHPAQTCCAQGLDFPWDCSPLVRNLGYRKNILSWLSPCWVSDALSQGQERCWTLSRETQGQTALKGGTGRAQDSFTHTFALLLLITRQCLCPPSVTKPPSAGGHCHGHRGLHRRTKTKTDKT